jgi:hypothetical protein
VEYCIRRKHLDCAEDKFMAYLDLISMTHNPATTERDLQVTVPYGAETTADLQATVPYSANTDGQVTLSYAAHFNLSCDLFDDFPEFNNI